MQFLDRLGRENDSASAAASGGGRAYYSSNPSPPRTVLSAFEITPIDDNPDLDRSVVSEFPSPDSSYPDMDAYLAAIHRQAQYVDSAPDSSVNSPYFGTEMKRVTSGVFRSSPASPPHSRPTSSHQRVRVQLPSPSRSEPPAAGEVSTPTMEVIGVPTAPIGTAEAGKATVVGTDDAPVPVPRTSPLRRRSSVGIGKQPLGYAVAEWLDSEWSLTSCLCVCGSLAVEKRHARVITDDATVPPIEPQRLSPHPAKRDALTTLLALEPESHAVRSPPPFCWKTGKEEGWKWC